MSSPSKTNDIGSVFCDFGLLSVTFFFDLQRMPINIIGKIDDVMISTLSRSSLRFSQ